MKNVFEQDYYRRIICEKSRIRNRKGYSDVATAVESLGKIEEFHNNEVIILREGDELLMSGYSGQAIKFYFSCLLKNFSIAAILKIIRWLFWMIIPQYKHRYFSSDLKKLNNYFE